MKKEQWIRTHTLGNTHHQRISLEGVCIRQTATEANRVRGKGLIITSTYSNQIVSKRRVFHHEITILEAVQSTIENALKAGDLLLHYLQTSEPLGNRFLRLLIENKQKTGSRVQTGVNWLWCSFCIVCLVERSLTLGK